MSLALGCPSAAHHWRQVQRGSSVPRQHATRCCASRLQWRRGSLLPGQGPQLLRGGVGPAFAVPIVRSSGLAQKPRLTFVGAAGGSADGMSPDKTQFADKLADGNLRPPPISKPDAQFVEDMGLEFVYTREGIVLTELNDLFEKVGFPRRDIDKLRVALENTYHLIWIRSTKQSRLARMGQMVGFARATSDGVLSATIWDVAILPAWQRSGLGRALMERLTARLVQDDIPTITLYAEPHVVGLYEKLGFMKDPDGIRGMAFQRKKRSKAGQLQPALSR